MKHLAHILLPVFILAGCATQPPAPVVDRTKPVSAKPTVSAPAGATYMVKRGETLYRIASERGIAYRDLAAWNNITDPSSVKEGQVLRLTPPGAGDSVAVTQPVQATSQVESRPLGAAPTPVSETAKREPKVQKEPYSDSTWDLLQRAQTFGPSTTPTTPAAAETRPAASAAGINWGWPTSGQVIAQFGEGGNKGIDFAGKEGDAIAAAADGRVFFVGLQKGYGNLLIIGHTGGFISVYAHNRRILVAEKQTVAKGQKVSEMGRSDSESVKLHFEIRLQGKPVDPALYLPKR